MNNRNDELFRATKELMLEEPFYGSFLSMLNKEWVPADSNIKTMAIAFKNGNYHLLINEAFWDSISVIQRKGLLKHELIHIGFSHPTDFRHLSNKELANVAQDLEINQYIDPKALPEGSLSIDDPMYQVKGQSLSPRDGTLNYYKHLLLVLEEEKNNGGGPLTDLINDLRDNKNQSGNNWSTNHSNWQKDFDVSEAETKLAKAQMEHTMKEVAKQTQKSRGTIPGEFAELIEDLKRNEPPKFNWKAYLRRFAGGGTKVFTKKLRRKANHRFPGMPGLKIKQKRHILVAIDTSGSVSNDELVEFFQEIDHIYKTGTEVTVIQADTAISNIAEYDPKKDVKVHGRGGTDFVPVVDYYNDNTKKYTCLIYFTDGYAPAPGKAKGRMLWVISSHAEINKSLIGPQIKLN